MLGAAIYLYNPLRFSLPIGYAGLFSLMAETIRAEGWALPRYIPFYGPGGIPFAYPPAGPYLLALATQLTGASVFDVLRFLPAILSILFLVGVYAFALVILEDRGKAILAALLVATAGEVYASQATASGAVRSLAAISLIGCLTAATAAYRTSRSAKGLVLLAGTLFGLTILSHLSYALVGLIGLAALTLDCGIVRRRVAVGRALAVVVLGVVVSMPWWATVISRHGMDVFVYALQSHGNTGLADRARVDLPGTLVLMVRWVFGLGEGWQPAALVGLILIGLAYAVIRRRWAWLVWFLGALFLVGEPDRYLIVIGAMLTADMLVALGGLDTAKVREAGAGLRIAGVGLVLLFCVWGGARALRAMSPSLSQPAIALGDWVREHTPSDATFLFASGEHDLAEWMPYLLRRSPVAAPWGSEWTGRFGYEPWLFGEVGICAETESLTCLWNLMSAEGLDPSYMIIPQEQRSLVAQAESDPGLQLVHDSEGFRVYKIVPQG